MSVPVVTVPAAATLEDAVDSGFVTHLHGACPVVDASRVVGLRSLRVVRRFPGGRRRTVRARDVMSVEPALLIEPDTPVTELLSGTEFLRVGRAVVVDADGRHRGIISSTDVQRRAHMDELRSGGAPGTQRAA